MSYVLFVFFIVADIHHTVGGFTSKSQCEFAAIEARRVMRNRGVEVTAVCISKDGKGEPI